MFVCKHLSLRINLTAVHFSFCPVATMVSVSLLASFARCFVKIVCPMGEEGGLPGAQIHTLLFLIY